MTTVKKHEIAQPVMNEPVEQLRAQLEQEKRRINEEINNYPPPIPACDAQFNYLLEERARIFQALNDLEALPPQQHLTHDEDE